MQITLTDSQYERLRAESGASGSPIAALVRRSIDNAFGPELADPEGRLAAARAARGIWADRGDEVFLDWRELRGERPYLEQ
ncbi:MAG: hypothetical protein QOD61_470 [Solirubrobacteraceae bacterium]|nr:hypothetical protein [Solirubrobacteraceae bacterium]